MTSIRRSWYQLLLLVAGLAQLLLIHNAAPTEAVTLSGSSGTVGCSYSGQDLEFADPAGSLSLSNCVCNNLIFSGTIPSDITITINTVTARRIRFRGLSLTNVDILISGATLSCASYIDIHDSTLGFYGTTISGGSIIADDITVASCGIHILTFETAVITNGFSFKLINSDVKSNYWGHISLMHTQIDSSSLFIGHGTVIRVTYVHNLPINTRYLAWNSVNFTIHGLSVPGHTGFRVFAIDPDTTFTHCVLSISSFTYVHTGPILTQASPWMALFQIAGTWVQSKIIITRVTATIKTKDHGGMVMLFGILGAGSTLTVSDCNFECLKSGESATADGCALLSCSGYPGYHIGMRIHSGIATVRNTTFKATHSYTATTMVQNSELLFMKDTQSLTANFQNVAFDVDSLGNSAVPLELARASFGRFIGTVENNVLNFNVASHTFTSVSDVILLYASQALHPPYDAATNCDFSGNIVSFDHFVLNTPAGASIAVELGTSAATANNGFLFHSMTFARPVVLSRIRDSVVEVKESNGYGLILQEDTSGADVLVRESTVSHGHLLESLSSAILTHTHVNIFHSFSRGAGIKVDGAANTFALHAHDVSFNTRAGPILNVLGAVTDSHLNFTSINGTGKTETVPPAQLQTPFFFKGVVTSSSLHVSGSRLQFANGSCFAVTGIAVDLRVDMRHTTINAGEQRTSVAVFPIPVSRNFQLSLTHVSTSGASRGNFAVFGTSSGTGGAPAHSTVMAWNCHFGGKSGGTSYAGALWRAENTDASAPGKTHGIVVHAPVFQFKDCFTALDADTDGNNYLAHLDAIVSGASFTYRGSNVQLGSAITKTSKLFSLNRNFENSIVLIDVANVTLAAGSPGTATTGWIEAQSASAQTDWTIANNSFTFRNFRDFAPNVHKGALVRLFWFQHVEQFAVGTAGNHFLVENVFWKTHPQTPEVVLSDTRFFTSIQDSTWIFRNNNFQISALKAQLWYFAATLHTHRLVRCVFTFEGNQVHLAVSTSHPAVFFGENALGWGGEGYEVHFNRNHVHMEGRGPIALYEKLNGYFIDSVVSMQHNNITLLQHGTGNMFAAILGQPRGNLSNGNVLFQHNDVRMVSNTTANTASLMVAVYIDQQDVTTVSQNVGVSVHHNQILMISGGGTLTAAVRYNAANLPDNTLQAVDVNSNIIHIEQTANTTDATRIVTAFAFMVKDGVGQGPLNFKNNSIFISSRLSTASAFYMYGLAGQPNRNVWSTMALSMTGNSVYVESTGSLSTFAHFSNLKLWNHATVDNNVVTVTGTAASPSDSSAVVLLISSSQLIGDSSVPWSFQNNRIYLAARAECRLLHLAALTATMTSTTFQMSNTKAFMTGSAGPLTTGAFAVSTTGDFDVLDSGFQLDNTDITVHNAVASAAVHIPPPGKLTRLDIESSRGFTWDLTEGGSGIHAIVHLSNHANTVNTVFTDIASLKMHVVNFGEVYLFFTTLSTGCSSTYGHAMYATFEGTSALNISGQMSDVILFSAKCKLNYPLLTATFPHWIISGSSTNIHLLKFGFSADFRPVLASFNDMRIRLRGSHNSLVLFHCGTALPRNPIYITNVDILVDNPSTSCSYGMLMNGWRNYHYWTDSIFDCMGAKGAAPFVHNPAAGGVKAINITLRHPGPMFLVDATYSAGQYEFTDSSIDIGAPGLDMGNRCGELFIVTKDSRNKLYFTNTRVTSHLGSGTCSRHVLFNFAMTYGSLWGIRVTANNATFEVLGSLPVSGGTKAVFLLLPQAAVSNANNEWNFYDSTFRVVDTSQKSLRLFGIHVDNAIHTKHLYFRWYRCIFDIQQLGGNTSELYALQSRGTDDVTDSYFYFYDNTRISLCAPHSTTSFLCVYGMENQIGNSRIFRATRTHAYDTTFDIHGGGSSSVFFFHRVILTECISAFMDVRRITVNVQSSSPAGSHTLYQMRQTTGITPGTATAGCPIQFETVTVHHSVGSSSDADGSVALFDFKKSSIGSVVFEAKGLVWITNVTSHRGADASVFRLRNGASLKDSSIQLGFSGGRIQWTDHSQGKKALLSDYGSTETSFINNSNFILSGSGVFTPTSRTSEGGFTAIHLSRYLHIEGQLDVTLNDFDAVPAHHDSREKILVAFLEAPTRNLRLHVSNSHFASFCDKDTAFVEMTSIAPHHGTHIELDNTTFKLRNPSSTGHLVFAGGPHAISHLTILSKSRLSVDFSSKVASVILLTHANSTRHVTAKIMGTGNTVRLHAPVEAALINVHHYPGMELVASDFSVRGMRAHLSSSGSAQLFRIGAAVVNGMQLDAQDVSLTLSGLNSTGRSATLSAATFPENGDITNINSTWSNVQISTSSARISQFVSIDSRSTSGNVAFSMTDSEFRFDPRTTTSAYFFHCAHHGDLDRLAVSAKRVSMHGAASNEVRFWKIRPAGSPSDRLLSASLILESVNVVVNQTEPSSTAAGEVFSMVEIQSTLDQGSFVEAMNIKFTPWSSPDRSVAMFHFSPGNLVQSGVRVDGAEMSSPAGVSHSIVTFEADLDRAQVAIRGVATPAAAKHSKKATLLNIGGNGTLSNADILVDSVSASHLVTDSSSLISFGPGRSSLEHISLRLTNVVLSSKGPSLHLIHMSIPTLFSHVSISAENVHWALESPSGISNAILSSHAAVFAKSNLTLRDTAVLFANADPEENKATFRIAETRGTHSSQFVLDNFTLRVTDGSGTSLATRDDVAPGLGANATDLLVLADGDASSPMRDVKLHISGSTFDLPPSLQIGLARFTSPMNSGSSTQNTEVTIAFSHFRSLRHLLHFESIAADANLLVRIENSAFTLHGNVENSAAVVYARKLATAACTACAFRFYHLRVFDVAYSQRRGRTIDPPSLLNSQSTIDASSLTFHNITITQPFLVVDGREGSVGKLQNSVVKMTAIHCLLSEKSFDRRLVSGGNVTSKVALIGGNLVLSSCSITLQRNKIRVEIGARQAPRNKESSRATAHFVESRISMQGGRLTLDRNSFDVEETVTSIPLSAPFQFQDEFSYVKLTGACSSAQIVISNNTFHQSYLANAKVRVLDLQASASDSKFVVEGNMLHQTRLASPLPRFSTQPDGRRIRQSEMCLAAVGNGLGLTHTNLHLRVQSNCLVIPKTPSMPSVDEQVDVFVFDGGTFGSLQADLSNNHLVNENVQYEKNSSGLLTVRSYANMDSSSSIDLRCNTRGRGHTLAHMWKPMGAGLGSATVTTSTHKTLEDDPSCKAVLPQCNLHTFTPTISPSISSTKSDSATPTSSGTNSLSESQTGSDSESPTATQTATLSASASASESLSPTATETVTPPPTPTATSSLSQSIHLLSEAEIVTIASVMHPHLVYFHPTLRTIFIAQTPLHQIATLAPSRRAEAVVIAGTGTGGYLEGVAPSAARFNRPLGITSRGNTLYVADTDNHVIRSFALSSPTTTTTLIAGTPTAPGHMDGTALTAVLDSPHHLIASSGHLYWTEPSQFIVRQFDFGTFLVATIGGVAGSQGTADGGVGVGFLFDPVGLTMRTQQDESTLYIVESSNGRIRALHIPSKTLSTLSGSKWHPGFYDNVPAALAVYNHPTALCSNSIGDVLVCDNSNKMLRKMQFSVDRVTRLAGAGVGNSTLDGPALQAHFGSVFSCSVQTAGGTAVAIADVANHRIRVMGLGSKTASMTLTAPKPFFAEALRLHLLNYTKRHPIFTVNSELRMKMEPGTLYLRVYPVNPSTNHADVPLQELVEAGHFRHHPLRLTLTFSSGGRLSEAVECLALPCDVRIHFAQNGREVVEMQPKYFDTMIQPPTMKLDVTVETVALYPKHFKLLLQTAGTLYFDHPFDVSATLLSQFNSTLPDTYGRGSMAVYHITSNDPKCPVQSVQVPFVSNQANLAHFFAPYDRAAGCIPAALTIRASVNWLEPSSLKTFSFTAFPMTVALELCQPKPMVEGPGLFQDPLHRLIATAGYLLLYIPHRHLPYILKTAVPRVTITLSTGATYDAVVSRTHHCQLKCIWPFVPPDEGANITLSYTVADTVSVSDVPPPALISPIILRGVAVQLIGRVPRTQSIHIPHLGGMKVLKGIGGDQDSSSSWCWTFHLADENGNAVPFPDNSHLEIKGVGEKFASNLTTPPPSLVFATSHKSNASDPWTHSICNLSVPATNQTLIVKAQVIGGNSPSDRIHLHWEKAIHFTVNSILCRPPQISSQNIAGCQACTSPSSPQPLLCNCARALSDEKLHFTLIGDRQVETAQSRPLVLFDRFGVCNTSTTVDFEHQLVVDGLHCSVVPPNRHPTSTTPYFLHQAGLLLTLPAPHSRDSVHFLPPPPPPPVTITAVDGCTTLWPSTAECNPDGKTPVTVHGRGFNPQTMNITFITTFDEFPCLSHDRSPTASQNQNELVCLLYPGFGQFGQVIIHNASDRNHVFAASTNRSTLSFVPGLEENCGRDAGGRLCGNGKCSGTTGFCECFASNTSGYWDGPVCDRCALSHNSSAGCRIKCPTGTSSLPCNARGMCAEGVCTCHYGFGGPSCQLKCPGVGPICSGHGICSSVDATCSCYSNASHGFFVPGNCSICQEGYSGDNCDKPCPRQNGVVCNAQGVCFDGLCYCREHWCGDSCETFGEEACDDCGEPGLYGAVCLGVCPGGKSTPCFGHGICDSGRSGSGTCSCDSGFATADCSVICPGGFANPCSGHGSCSIVTGICTCDTFYAGAACDWLCPGMNTEGTIPCAGHGRCLDGSIGSGECVCDTGYTSSNCTQICPGGLATPCSGRGACNNNGTCTCHRTPDGYYDGFSCDQCLEGWFGPNCNKQCAKVNDLQCNGRGTCTSTLDCICHRAAHLGFWTEVNCTSCVSGYFGSDCIGECPGGSCNQCSGHGNCSDGLEGTGLCNCTANATHGYWAGGEDCAQCTPGYFGVNCLDSCTGWNNITGEVCGGHGTCSDGTGGDGSCSCNDGFRHDSSQLCTLCQPGRFGPACAVCGVDIPIGITTSCNGHGLCADGISGTGACSCFLGYQGPVCEFQCPVAWGSVVCGAGYCLWNNASCICEPNWQRDDSGACTQCIRGVFGSSCDQTCGTCENGYCRDGVEGDGTCVCSLGWYGTQCDQLCPGGTENPCNWNGDCEMKTGKCNCYSNTTHGHWAGETCEVCDPFYNSHNCTISCPTSGGNVCNNRGTCWNGTCHDCKPLPSDIESQWCGSSCHFRDIQCIDFSTNCEHGFWGPGCLALCPGAASDGANACSGHGLCNPDSGECFCEAGYFGVDCTSVCPTSIVNGQILPCGGRGACTTEGNCHCREGYFGVSCSLECPGGAASPCSGFGRCDVDGHCHCDSGSFGDSCQHECPGGRETPCSNRGSCNAFGDCECTTNSATGFFAGTDCTDCVAGFGGHHCRETCNSEVSTTVRNFCQCSYGYGGPTCHSECPGLESLDGLCNGHGVCNQGHVGDAKCVCDPHYYGVGCETFCTVDHCKAQGLEHPMCEPSNGTCVCANGPSSPEQFDGALCDQCLNEWWGVFCSTPCPCNKHGGCDRWTGQCYCYRDDTNGYWDGLECTKCLKGYIGLDCRSKNIELSKSTTEVTTSARIKDEHAPAHFIKDPETGIKYVGNRPLVVILPDRLLPTSIEFETRIVSLVLRPGALWIETEPNPVLNETTVQTYLLPRGSGDPDQLQQLNVNHSATTAGGRRRLEAEAATGSTAAEFGGVRTAASNGENVTCRVYESGAIVVSLRNSLSQVSDFTFGAENHSISLVRYLKVEADTIIVSGTTAGNEWGVAVFTFNASGVYLNAFSNANTKLELCQGTLGCRSALACINDHGIDRIVCVLWRDDGPLLASFGIATSPFPFVGTRVYASLGDFNVTAMAIDDATGLRIGVLAMNSHSVPSDIIKFNLNTLVVTSLYTLEVSGVYVERCTGLSVDSEARNLYAIVQTPLSFRVDVLNLFGLHSIFPDILDSKGGTLVTVKGEGFSPLGALECSFDRNGTTTNATFIDNKTLVCHSSPSMSTGGQCDTIQFNVEIAGRRTESSNVPIKQPQSATLIAVNTSLGDSFGRINEEMAITVSGFGFIASQWATCNLMNAAGGLVWSVKSIYLSNSKMICPQPLTQQPTDKPSFLRYSHDGQIFGAGAIVYAIVGVPAMLVAETKSTTIVSGYQARVPTLKVFVADSKQNYLLRFDERPRLIQASVDPVSGENIYPFSPELRNATMKASKKGEVVFDQITLLKPLATTVAIRCRFRFKDLLGQIFTDVTEYTVVVGVPAQILVAQIVDETYISHWRIGVEEPRELRPHPTATIADAAGNVVRSAQGIAQLPKELYITYPQAYYGTNGDPSERMHSVASKIENDGSYIFQNIFTTGIFGSTYTLTFASPGASIILPVESPFIQLQKCDENSYGEIGSFDCLPCPRYGQCDGSTTVTSLPGYWRASISAFTFYECHPPHSASSCTSGNGCKDGYQGIRCSVCAPGYGKSGRIHCTKCFSREVNIVLLLLAAIVVLVLVLILITRSIKSGLSAVDGNGKRDIIPIIIKIILSHFQIISLAPAASTGMPAFVTTFLSGQGQAATFSPNLSFVSCDLTPTISAKVNFLLTAAPFMIGVFLFVMAVATFIEMRRSRLANQGGTQDEVIEQILEDEVKRNHRELLGEDEDDDERFESSAMFRDVFDVRVAAEEGDDRRVARRPDATVRGGKSFFQQWLEKVAVASVVILFLLYTTILEDCGKLLSCESIDVGGGVMESVLVFDRSVSCDSEEYHSVRGRAITCMIVYGAGIPFFSVVIVKFIQLTTMKGDAVKSKMLFYFITGGLRSERWFWEAIILMRKGTIVLCVTFFSSFTLRSYAAMWASGIFLAANVMSNPWDNPVLSRLEVMSNLVITATFNLSLLFSYFPEEEDPNKYYLIVTLVFAINVIILTVFLQALIKALRQKAVQLMLSQSAFSGAYAQIVEDEDAKVVNENKARRGMIESTRVRIQKRHGRTGLMMDVIDEARATVKLLVQRRQKQEHAYKLVAFSNPSYALPSSSLASEAVNSSFFAPSPCEGHLDPAGGGTFHQQLMEQKVARDLDLIRALHEAMDEYLQALRLFPEVLKRSSPTSGPSTRRSSLVSIANEKREKSDSLCSLHENTTRRGSVSTLSRSAIVLEVSDSDRRASACGDHEFTIIFEKERKILVCINDILEHLRR